MPTQFELQLISVIQNGLRKTGTEDAILAKYFGDTLTAMNILRAALGVPTGAHLPGAVPVTSNE